MSFIKPFTSLLLLMIISLNEADSVYADKNHPQQLDFRSILTSLNYLKLGSHQSSQPLKPFAILYTQSDEASHQMAKQYLTLITTRVNELNLPIQPMLISQQELIDNETDIDYLLLLNPIELSNSQLENPIVNQGIFTIGIDKQCAESGLCILAFEHSDTINIYLNQDALRSRGFGLKGAFKFMVKRL